MVVLWLYKLTNGDSKLSPLILVRDEVIKNSNIAKIMSPIQNLIQGPFHPPTPLDVAKK